jgi:hypothetical protein
VSIGFAAQRPFGQKAFFLPLRQGLLLATLGNPTVDRSARQTVPKNTRGEQ